MLQTVQKDMEEASDMIVDKLQPQLDGLRQQVSDLTGLAKLREMAIATPGLLLDVFFAERQLHKGEVCVHCESMHLLISMILSPVCVECHAHFLTLTLTNKLRT